MVFHVHDDRPLHQLARESHRTRVALNLLDAELLFSDMKSVDCQVPQAEINP